MNNKSNYQSKYKALTISDIAEEMMSSSREFYTDRDNLNNQNKVKSHVKNLKRLRDQAQKCPSSPRKVEVIRILDKAVKGLSKRICE